MKLLRYVVLALFALGCGKASLAPSHGKVGAVSAGIFHTIPFGYDPSASGWPGAVGDIVQNAGGLTAWQRSGQANTAWVSVPTSGSGGGISPDGGVLYPLACTGTGTCGTAANPLGVADGGIQSPSNVHLLAGTIVGGIGAVVISGYAPWTEYHQGPTGSPGASVIITGLLGDTDGAYDIVGDILIAGSTVLEFNWNGIVTSMPCYRGDFATGSANFTTWTVGHVAGNITFAAGDLIHIVGYLSTRSGRTRYGNLEFTITPAAGVTSMYRAFIFGEITDTTTPITSFGVNTSANAINTGSFLRATVHYTAL